MRMKYILSIYDYFNFSRYSIKLILKKYEIKDVTLPVPSINNQQNPATNWHELRYNHRCGNPSTYKQIKSTNTLIGQTDRQTDRQRDMNHHIHTR